MASPAAGAALAFRERGLKLYDEIQAKVPLEWRLTDQSLCAPAWIGIEEVDPSAVKKDVRHVLAECGILTAAELDIIKKDAPELAQLIAARTLTSLEVTTAFCKASAVAQQLWRCCTELFYDEALERAKEIDDYLAAHGKTVGILHGVPISIKDHVNKKGIRSTMGLTSQLDHVAEDESPLVTALEAQGAVIFVKTNVPATLMSASTVNYIFGRTQNPYDRTRTAGGSSGGEGALIAVDGSPLGIGSDIAGSIRMPAAMCGIYGFKPSPGRLSLAGVVSCTAGAEFVAPTLGPMGHSVAALDLFMKAVLERDIWKLDSTCLRLPWRKVSFDRPLRIGVLRNNGLVRPHPPVSRVIEEAAAKIAAAGHEVLEWDVQDLHVRADQLSTAFFRQDGGSHIVAALQDEPVSPTVECGSPEDVLSIDKIMERYWQAIALRNEYLQKWQALDLDAVLCPTASHAAVPHDEYNDTSNTVPFNMLQYCAMTMPYGQVEERDLVITDEYRNYKPLATYPGPTGLSKQFADKVNHQNWLNDEKRNSSLGLPLSIQIVCPPQCDEECVAISGIIDDILKK